MTALLLVALGTGLVGTIHCAAMCGPLVAASRGGVSYFAGRLLSYATVGAIMGAIGQHALCLLPVERVQHVAVGLVAAFAAWKAVSALRRPRPPRPLPLGRRRPSLLARVFAHVPRRGFGLGLATGILPCGMLVPAWTLAMSSGDALSGAAIMAAFFTGSAPGLLAPLVAGRWLATRVPRAVQAGAWTALALWTLARPLLAVIHHH